MWQRAAHLTYICIIPITCPMARTALAHILLPCNLPPPSPLPSFPVHLPESSAHLAFALRDVLPFPWSDDSSYIHVLLCDFNFNFNPPLPPHAFKNTPYLQLTIYIPLVPHTFKIEQRLPVRPRTYLPRLRAPRPRLPTNANAPAPTTAPQQGSSLSPSTHNQTTTSAQLTSYTLSIPPL